MPEKDAENLISECKRIEKDSEFTAEAHHIIATYYSLINYIVMLVPAAVAAVSGIMVISGASRQVAWLAIISGVVFAVATIIGPERTENDHTKAGKDYTALKHDARALYESFYQEISQAEFYIAVRVLRVRYNSLVAHTPKTSERAFKKARERIREGRHKQDNQTV